MAIGDASARQLDIVGPPGILHILASMRHFFYRSVPFFFFHILFH